MDDVADGAEFYVECFFSDRCGGFEFFFFGFEGGLFFEEGGGVFSGLRGVRS